MGIFGPIFCRIVRSVHGVRNIVCNSKTSMNIFVLSLDPFEAASMQCDKHVVKMVLETAQILSTVKTLLNEEGAPYKPTHVNHPCVTWAKITENRRWLTWHLKGCY